MLAAATFPIFFQAFMIAPLIPRLAVLFDSTPSTVGWAVPAYLIPYGVMTLVWGPLSDRVGRGPVILGSLGAFVVLTATTAATGSAGVFLAARLITAVGASGVVPISLALIGDVVPPGQRGRALGTFFAAMAGGIAFGSSAGALVEPVLGWRGLFLTVAGAGAAAMIGLLRLRQLFSPPARWRHRCGWSPGATSISWPIVAAGGPTPMCSSTRCCARASTPGSGCTSSGDSISARWGSAWRCSATASPAS